MKGMIFDIKEFGVHDGPGLITTVFLKGCPLRCAWCHNPEGQHFVTELMVRENSCKHCGLCTKGCGHPECQPFKRCVHICPGNLVSIVGGETEAKELAERILKNRDIVDGVTFSGGEPLAQPHFLLEVISHLKGMKINIETSGFCNPELFKQIADRIDLIYLDIKLADDEQHRRYTGQGNALILQNLQYLKENHKNFIIRTPLIPGITDTAENLSAIQGLIGNCAWEKLPYNEMADVKYRMLSREYPLKTNKKSTKSVAFS